MKEESGMSDNNAILKLLAGQTTRLSHVETQLEEAKNLTARFLRLTGFPAGSINSRMIFLAILEELDNE